MQKAIEFLLCSELKQNAVNPRVIAQLPSQQISPVVRELLVAFYVNQLEKM